MSSTKFKVGDIVTVKKDMVEGNFKVGDKVKMINTKILSGIPNGTTGVVLEVYTKHGDDYLAVKLEKYGTGLWYAHRFQLANNYKKRITTY